MSVETGTYERLWPMRAAMADARLPVLAPLSGSRTGVRDAHLRHGFSHEFAGHREYSPGDDLRYFDWKAYARSDRFHLKRFHDETDTKAQLLLDLSAGMNFRGKPDSPSKFEHAKLLLGISAWLLLRAEMEISLAAFDEKPIPGLSHGKTSGVWEPFLRKMDELVTTVGNGRNVSAVGVLGRFGASLRERNLILIASDFMFDELDSILASLRILAKRGHRLLLFHVLDPAEIELPYEVPVRFEPFGPGRHIEADVPRIRAAYREEMRSFLKQIVAASQNEGITYIPVRTDEPILKPFLGHGESGVGHG